MKKQILFIVIIISMSYYVFAQGTGEGGAIAPQPSNASAGGGGMVNSSANVSYDSAILEAFGGSKWIRILVYYETEDISNMSFKDLEEREEYVRNKTKLTFSYIPETKMKIIQTGLDPDSFSAEITKEGFDKLINDSRIKNVYLGTMVHITSSDENEAISENKSENITMNNRELNVSETDKIKEKGMKLKLLWIFIGIIVIVFVIILYITIRKKR